MHKIFSSVQRFPTFEQKRCKNVCKTLCIRYEIVQFVRLSFRMRLAIVDKKPAIVRKRWHSFALYIACYTEWADQLCATKPLNQFILHARVRDSAIMTRLLCYCWGTGSSWRLLRLYRRTGSTWRGSSLPPGLLWERGGAAGRGGFFHLEASSVCRDFCQSRSSTNFYDTNQWWRRFPAFYTAYWKMSWQRQLIAGGSLLSRFTR